MTQEVLHNWGNIILNGNFFDSIVKNHIFKTQVKVYSGAGGAFLE